MNRIIVLLVGIMAATLAVVTPGAAQVAVEVRGGAAVGNHEPAAAGLETVAGPEFGALIEYAPWAPLSFYAGYTRSRFGCEEGFCEGQPMNFTSAAFSGGVRLHPGRLLWIRLGAVYSGLTGQSDDGGSRTTLDPGFGYEVGAGFTVPLAGRVRFLPGLAYRRFTAESVATSVVSGEVGIQVRIRK